MPEYFLRLEKLPLTPNGKVLKRELVDAIRRGEITPVPVRFRPELKEKLSRERREAASGGK
jgi:acyl-CoA synthetase